MPYSAATTSVLQRAVQALSDAVPPEVLSALSELVEEERMHDPTAVLAAFASHADATTDGDSDAD